MLAGGMSDIKRMENPISPYDKLNSTIQTEQNENNAGMTCAWNERIQLIRHDEA